MEIALILGAALVAVALVLVLAGRLTGRRRHKLTTPELRNRARREAEGIAELIEGRQRSRPQDEPVIKHHEFPHRRVTVHDEETRGIYVRDHLPEVSLLQQQFSERHVHNRMLNSLYESPENEADLRTIATALEEMADRLQQSAADRR